MLNKIPLSMQLIFLVVLTVLFGTVQADYCCCLQVSDNRYRDYCATAAKTKGSCEDAGLKYDPGYFFGTFHSGCDRIDSDSQAPADRKKRIAFVDACGGKGSYKCYW